MSTKTEIILKQARKLNDRSLAREIRTAAAASLLKIAEDGILEHFKGKAPTSETKPALTSERGGKDEYNSGIKHEKSNLTTDVFDRSLSTRYSPDRVGVMARRIADGVYQDPITNKVYDWNEGFTTEDGEKFNGGRVSLQTDLYQKK